MDIQKFFEIREELPSNINTIVMVSGITLLILLWSLISTIWPSPNVPPPWAVLGSFKELHFQDALVRNLGYSVKLNVIGYLEAIAISLPLGFFIGLFPLTKGLFNKPVDALRFVPLTAVTGLFIAWFGIGDAMKIHFLAFGIIVYLLPAVVQRIMEVDVVYEQTVKTLGANKWQLITTVFIPATMSKIWDDIRLLTAISWTYIIVAELVNKTGGVGAMAYTAARMSRIDKVFAILLVIIIVGFVQDKILKSLDRIFFPYKYS